MIGAPPPPDGDNDAVKNAEEILLATGEQIQVESVFVLAIRVGVALNQWRELMLEEGGYSQEWVEETALTMFHQFFQPFTPPPFSIGHDDD